jgi:hypothetical protein
MVLDLRLNEKIGLSGDNLLFFNKQTKPAGLKLSNKDEVPNKRSQTKPKAQTSEAKQGRSPKPSNY